MSAWRNRRPESPYLSLILAIGGLSFVRSPKRQGVASYLIGLLIDEKVGSKLAGEFGTDAAVGVEKENLLEVVKKMTKAIGADMVVENKGLPPCNP